MPHTIADLRHTSDPGSADVATVALESSFAPLLAEYRELFGASDGGAFEHPLWLDAFYRRLAPERGARPLLVTGRNGAGRLEFVLPLITRRKSGVTLIETHDLGVSDYSAPVIRTGFVAQPDLKARIAAILPPHDILRIRPVREENLRHWAAFLEAEPCRLDFHAHATALPESYAAWRKQAYAESFARYLDKKKRRFFKSPGATLRLLTDATELRAAIGAIQSGRAGRFDGDLIQQDHVRDFYAEIAIDGAGADFARTYALSVDGHDIGHAFGLTHGGRFHYLLIACDYHRHGRHSPGLILYDGMIADWIAAGGSTFDFTIGDEPFKTDFGTAPTAMFELRSLPTLRGRLAGAAFAARERFRRFREARAAGNAG